MKDKIVTFGEIMLRLSPENNARFTQCNAFEAVYGGGEANTAVSLANFDVDANYVTKLPKHIIGQAAINSLRQYGVGVDHIVRGGDQIGIYFLEKKTSSVQLTLSITEQVLHLRLLLLMTLIGTKYLTVQHGSIFQESHLQSLMR